MFEKLFRKSASSGFDRKKENTTADKEVTVVQQSQKKNLSTETVTNSQSLNMDDMLAEADVYWTYGKFHDALIIYRWWLESDGLGTPYTMDTEKATEQKRVAFRAVDATVQVQDFKLCEIILIVLEKAGYPKEFLAEQGLYALKHDPSNFFLIEYCNNYTEDNATIESIVQKTVIRNETAQEKKAKLWKKNRTDANKIAVTSGKSRVSRMTWDFSDRGVDLLTTALHQMNDDDAIRYANIAFSDLTINESESRILGNLCGTGLLEDDAGGLCPSLNESIFESIFQAMVVEAHTRPQNLGIQVEILRILHDEGDLSRYAQWLFHLTVVLFRFGSGESLRRRLLAAGKLLGPHPLWDKLSTYMDVDTLKKTGAQYRLPMPWKIETELRSHVVLVSE